MNYAHLTPAVLLILVAMALSVPPKWAFADEARKNLVARARSHDRNERFPAFWGPNFDWTPDQDHGGIMMKALQAMLLQTDGDKIFLLPAWPKDWDADFRLHAPRQTVVEGRIRGGKVADLKMTPAQRKKDVILPPAK